MGWWDVYKTTMRDPEFQRNYRRRELIKLGLVLLSMVLLSPVLVLFKLLNIESVWGFACLLTLVVLLVVIYRLLGWAALDYTPTSADAEPQLPSPETPRAGWANASAVVPPVLKPPPLETASDFDPAPLTASTPRFGCGAVAVIAAVSMVTLVSCAGICGLGALGFWTQQRMRRPADRVAPPAFARPSAQESIEQIRRQNEQMREQIQRDIERQRRDIQRQHEEIRKRIIGSPPY
jgi:hypothetical protein